MNSGTGVVVAVSSSSTHTIAKPSQGNIRLLTGLGVQGDAHQGATVKHRSLVARDPKRPQPPAGPPDSLGAA